MYLCHKNIVSFLGIRAYLGRGVQVWGVVVAVAGDVSGAGKLWCLWSAECGANMLGGLPGEHTTGSLIVVSMHVVVWICIVLCCGVL